MQLDNASSYCCMHVDLPGGVESTEAFFWWRHKVCRGTGTEASLRYFRYEPLLLDGPNVGVDAISPSKSVDLAATTRGRYLEFCDSEQVLPGN